MTYLETLYEVEEHIRQEEEEFVEVEEFILEDFTYTPFFSIRYDLLPVAACLYLIAGILFFANVSIDNVNAQEFLSTFTTEKTVATTAPQSQNPAPIRALQVMVSSTPHGAGKVVDFLTKKGYPAYFIEKNGNYYVRVACNHENPEQLREKIRVLPYQRQMSFRRAFFIHTRQEQDPTRHLAREM